MYPSIDPSEYHPLKAQGYSFPHHEHHFSLPASCEAKVQRSFCHSVVPLVSLVQVSVATLNLPDLAIGPEQNLTLLASNHIMEGIWDYTLSQDCNQGPSHHNGYALQYIRYIFYLMSIHTRCSLRRIETDIRNQHLDTPGILKAVPFPPRKCRKL